MEAAYELHGCHVLSGRTRSAQFSRLRGFFLHCASHFYSNCSCYFGQVSGRFASQSNGRSNDTREICIMRSTLL